MTKTNDELKEQKMDEDRKKLWEDFAMHLEENDHTPFDAREKVAADAFLDFVEWRKDPVLEEVAKALANARVYVEQQAESGVMTAYETKVQVEQALEKLKRMGVGDGHRPR